MPVSPTKEGQRKKSSADRTVRAQQPTETPGEAVRSRLAAERVTETLGVPAILPSPAKSAGWKIAKRALKITGGSVVGGGLILSVANDSAAAYIIGMINFLF